MLKRQDYWQIVQKHLQNPNLVKHCLAVEGAMKALAKKLNGSVEVWGNLGLVHDADWEETKDDFSKHTKLTEQWLTEMGETNQELIAGLLVHNYKHTGYREPKTPMEWALYTCDELTGLIVAVGLVRNKDLSGVTVESVIKKFPQTAFARAIDREQIKLCETKLNIPLPEFVGIVLASMKEIRGGARINMKRLLLATNNPGKLGEMKTGLLPLVAAGWQLLSLKDFQITSHPEEIGTTFKDNAILKAKHYADLSGVPTLSDDGGFVIPALNNEPGVRSRRWLGYEGTDEELIDYTLKRLKEAKAQDRSAYLELVLCFYDPLHELTLFENERIAGEITFAPSPRRIKGFPYRALLKVKPYGKYYDDLTPEEHDKVNHRFKALRKIVGQIKSLYGRKP